MRQRTDGNSGVVLRQGFWALLHGDLTGWESGFTRYHFNALM
jgi:hypothetical protein